MRDHPLTNTCSLFPFHESPLGNFSCLNPLDIALWSQSVLEEQNTDHYPSSLEKDEEDVIVPTTDMNFSPDDNRSAASGMDNSRYSQVNTFRRISRTGQGNPFYPQQHGYLSHGMVHPGNTFSPGVNSEGRGSSLMSSDRSQVPPGLVSSGTSDLTDNTFNPPDYANLATGQNFIPMPQVEYSEQSYQRLPTHLNDVGFVQNTLNPSFQEADKRIGEDPQNQPAFQSFPYQHSQIRTGSAASFVGNDNAQAVAIQPFSRPPLIHHDSSQAFSIQSANANEASSDLDYHMDSSQGPHFFRKPSAPEMNVSFQKGPPVSLEGNFDTGKRGSHSYLQHSEYVTVLLCVAL